MNPNQILAIKEAPPELWKSLVINIKYSNNLLELDPGFPLPYYPNILPPQPYPSGPYEIRILNEKDEVLYFIKIQPQAEQDILYLPYFLNAYKIEIINPNGVIKKYTIENFRICNENNICEPGEENLCPLDCKSAVNPNYLLTSKIEGLQKNLSYTTTGFSTTTTSIPTPANLFKNIFLTTIIVVGILAVLIFIIYLIKRRK